MKTTFRKITVTTLAVLTVLFTFCITSFAFEEKGGAQVIIDNEAVYYDDISKAWEAASTSEKEARIVLFEDWKGDNSCSMGKGKAFYNGAVLLKDREKPLTLDLNGHTIDRQCYTAMDDGFVFLIKNVKKFVITDSSDKGTGIIAGANNTGDGGAFRVYGSEMKLCNIIVEDNISLKRGGALCIDAYCTEVSERLSKITLDNCIIRNNCAETGGAAYLESSNTLEVLDTTVTENIAIADAGIHTEVCGFCTAKIILGGKVIIKDNISLTSGSGLMLDENFFTKVAIKFSKARPFSEESEIVVISKTGDRTLRLTFDSADSHKACFTYENDSYKIVEKGSGNSIYLELVKN